MAVLTGLTANGFARYREAARSTERAEPAARVTTRKFGLNLGQFGISYTQRDLRFDPRSAETDGHTARPTFLDGLNTELLREAVGRYAGPEPFSETSTLRHRGVAAYEAMALEPAPKPARVLLAVV